MDKDSNNFHEETNVAKLFHNGTIQWYTLAMTTSYCRVDVQHFPFDKQMCELTFTTWLYQTSEVQIFCLIDDIIHNESYKKYKKPSGVWDFKISNPLVGNASYDCSTCYDQEQSYVQYNLILTRTNHLWYMINYMFPCIVLSTMTIIIPFLSHKKGVDASSFGLTCVLTLFVFLTFLFTQLPATGPPGIGFYVVLLIVQAVIATVYVTAKVPKEEAEDQADSTSEISGDSGGDRLREIQNPIYRRLVSFCILATSIFKTLKRYLYKNPWKMVTIVTNICSCIVFCAILISWSDIERE
ncbi:Neuronal acetylcholine receptor subunit alpha-9 [Holothuria leucospilota]|uniref:Neuronal acetylcholine receptor subunit alpha-9 n=1 Tax=Holothuria leucospilota TaxID=206669 RepID=A0A9Q1CLW3_HOLLE|nr:Neuronal acetylcholine receptor subunit alpha-9 [Holothuria leucospilota]